MHIYVDASRAGTLHFIKCCTCSLDCILSIYCFPSGKCHAQCLEYAANPSDRFSRGGCAMCCMKDKDGDGFITKDELGQHFDSYCGQEEDTSKLTTYIILFCLMKQRCFHWFRDIQHFKFSQWLTISKFQSAIFF